MSSSCPAGPPWRWPSLVVISQVKLNVMNAYSGSLAWTNSFTQVTMRYPGRLVFVVFNVSVALLLDGTENVQRAEQHPGLLRELCDGLGGHRCDRHRDQQEPAEDLPDGGDHLENGFRCSHLARRLSGVGRDGIPAALARDARRLMDSVEHARLGDVEARDLVR